MGKKSIKNGQLQKLQVVYIEMPQQLHCTSQCATKEQHQDTKGYLYNKKAEKPLLNERVRMINNTINMFSWQIDTCKEELQNNLKKEDTEECYKFIDKQRDKAPEDPKETTREVPEIVPKIQVAAQTKSIAASALVATQTLTQLCHHYTINNKITSHWIQYKIRPSTTTTTTKTGSGTYPEDCLPRHKRRS